jgi:hypothetical protein
VLKRMGYDIQPNEDAPDVTKMEKKYLNGFSNFMSEKKM